MVSVIPRLARILQVLLMAILALLLSV